MNKRHDPIAMHSSDWVVSQPLHAVVDRLYQLASSEDPDAVTADEMVHFARRLIDAEVYPAGPYRDENGEVVVSLNRAIALLFHQWGRPLPSLEKYLNAADKAKVNKKRGVIAGAENRSYNKRHQMLARLLRSENTGTYRWLHQGSIQAIEGIIRLDKKRNEISAISFDWQKILGCRMDEVRLSKLARANMSLWIAYTLYDNIIDEDAGAVDYLSIANVYHRRAYNQYLSVADGLKQEKFVTDTFARMDEANYFERKSLRLAIVNGTVTIPRAMPRVAESFVANRAAGHILGPLLLLEKMAMSTYQKRQWAKILHQYLVVRQFCDDIHDWREDMEAGRLTMCTASLISELSFSPGLYPLIQVEDACKEIFWKQTLQASSQKYMNMVVAIETILMRKTNDTIAAKLFLSRAVTPLRETLEVGLRAVAGQKQFIARYRV